ncbi:MAG: hypothetical protein RL751_1862 [Bacteroidota bacterium]
MQNSHYKIGTPIYNQRFRQSLEANEDPLSVLFAKKIFKIIVRPKLVYYIELDYYEHTVFIKFYPKIMESEPDKFKKVGMGLKIAEVQKLLYTCCVLIYEEIQMSPQKVFSFVAQIYDRDNLLKRKKSIRFSVYKKIVTTYFNDRDYIHFNLEAYNFYCITRIENTTKFLPILQELTDAVSQDNHLLNEFVTIAQLQEWSQQH